MSYILAFPQDFSEHCFRLFDSDDSGDVSIQEIQAGLNKLSEYVVTHNFKAIVTVAIVKLLSLSSKRSRAYI